MNRSRSTAIAAALLVAWFVFATLALVFLAGRASAQPPEATCRTWANPVEGNTFVFSPGDYDLVIVRLVDGTSFELRDVVFEQRIDAAVPIAGLSKCDLPEPTPTPVVPTPMPESTPEPTPEPTPTATPERPTPTPERPTPTTPPAPTPTATVTISTPTPEVPTATPTATPEVPTATPTATPTTPTPQPTTPPNQTATPTPTPATPLADTGGNVSTLIAVGLVLFGVGGILLGARRWVR